MIQSLIIVAESQEGIDNLYWNVFAAPAKKCDRAVRGNLKSIRELAETVQQWNRLQPIYW